jgi:hypothetical protein
MISERRKPLAVSFCTPDLKGDVLPFDVTELAEPLPKSLKKSGGRSSGDRMPIRWSLTACCAYAASGNAAAAPARSVMKSRRCMCAPVRTTPCAMLDYKRSFLIGV